MARGDKLLKVTRARVILPAAGTVWTAAEILHAAHVSPLDPGLASLAAALAVRGSRARPLARATVAAGAWMTAATAWGPLAGPHGALTWVYGAGTVAGLLWANWHPAVREARQWREARFGWLSQAHAYDLGGSHMIGHEKTRLGEMYELDVRGTRKRASAIAGGSLGERIAEDEGLPKSRVKVTEGSVAGHVRVSVRHVDPWRNPITHPLFDADPEIVLPVPATIREPLPVGQDPETGRPLEVTLWDSDGGKTFQVVAKKGAGKTTLLSDLRERVTACGDAVLWGINVSKGVEDRDWAPLCEHSACGEVQSVKAIQILAAAKRVIGERGSAHRNDAVFQPTRSDPAIVVLIDEIDALVKADPHRVRELLSYIASKGRSEAVILVIAGQRATANWMGGADVRANIDYVAIGKVRSPGEVQHALGSMGFAVPDMTTYGEGKPGVWVIVDDAGDYQAGRAFKLDELTDIRRIAAQRAYHPEPVPVAAGSVTEPQTEEPSGIDHLDNGLLEDTLDPKTRGLLAKIDATAADTRRIGAANEQIIASLPDVPPEKMAESTAERWHQIAEQTEIPPGVLDALLAMLAGEGTSASKAAGAFGVSKWTARCWLEKLRDNGTAEIAGKGRGARWRLATATDGDDTGMSGGETGE